MFLRFCYNFGRVVKMKNELKCTKKLNPDKNCV